MTTPGVFWGSLSSDNVIDGSLARMLIFESENHYPDPQHQLAPNDPPADLVAIVEAVAKGADGSTPFPLGNAAAGWVARHAGALPIAGADSHPASVTIALSTSVLFLTGLYLVLRRVPEVDAHTGDSPLQGSGAVA